MDNAAHAESLGHEVYRTPLVVRPEFEFRTTPANYRLGYVQERKLPDQMKVWRVQNSPKGNVVAWGSGFEDSPDAEIIALGLNRAKRYGDVGIGRQGNVLQWGYGDPPSRMTEAGRRLFINCIHYIHRFDGRPPLVRRECEARLNALRWAPAEKGATQQKLAFRGTYPQDVMRKYQGRSDELNDYYVKNLELLYWDQGFRVDDDLRLLGLESNRKVDTLLRLIELLNDSQRAATARKLLDRYTDRAFETSQQWRHWFDENEDQVFFSDVGGYKFFVVPEGYLIGPDRETATGQPPSR
ncbi:MAG: hypothetical protein A2Y77_11060 [Planctomycetes bacterium RBG_13_62_9]|nr:MAG: hypothetical protein A2Y77_11060 [Planctomycetes bacterium RBG_13_62_9]